MKRILTTDWMHPKAIAPFVDDDVEFIMPEKYGQFTEEEVMSRLPECDGVLCVGKPFTKQQFDIANKIRVSGGLGGGLHPNCGVQYRRTPV